MFAVSRRVVLGAAALGLGELCLPKTAQATLVRGLSLEELARSSQLIVLGTALEASSHWETLGGRRRIVTDTRVRVDDVLDKGAPASEVLVRTLGGTVGDLAAMVFGEATLNLEERAVLFLAEQSGVQRVNGMAQGHYPLRLDAKKALRLAPSPRAPELVGKGDLAVKRLTGQELTQARVLIREALSK
jgi:hypothetical protein